MNDDELRDLVRAVIRQRLAAPAPESRPPLDPPHSYALLTMVRGAADGPCLIEPVVTCTHCGYCQSRGY
jgi:hypothetical protein